MFSLIKAVTLTQEQLDDYYIKKRRIIFEKTNGVPRGLQLHNLCHYILLPFIKCLRIMNKRNLIIIYDKRIKTKRPIVYACTHVGGVDVETAFEAIKKPCWLFLGDPREIYMNFDGFMLGLNGVICLDSKNKNDRKIAKLTAVELLTNGGNLLIYPEGAWNVSENLPVMGLFCGTAEIAIQTKADIIPVAIEFYENDIYVAIGRNIETKQFKSADKYIVTEQLRNTLATLKWDIWEKHGICSRKEISDEYSEQFVNNIINGNKETTYTLQDVYNSKFVNRDITDNSEAFAHLKKIIVSLNNAFLFNKRNHN